MTELTRYQALDRIVHLTRASYATELRDILRKSGGEVIIQTSTHRFNSKMDRFCSSSDRQLAKRQRQALVASSSTTHDLDALVDIIDRDVDYEDAKFSVEKCLWKESFRKYIDALK